MSKIFYITILFLFLTENTIAQVNHMWVYNYLRKGTSLVFWDKPLVGAIKSTTEKRFKLNSDSTEFLRTEYLESEFHENGLLRESKEFGQFTSEVITRKYYYNHSGLLKKLKTDYSENSIHKERYRYFPNGQMKSQIYKSPLSFNLNKSSYKYDASGNLIEWATMEFPGITTIMQKYEYDKSGNLIYHHYSNYGKHESTYTQQFSREGDKMKIISTLKGAKPDNDATYFYDSLNNIIKINESNFTSTYKYNEYNQLIEYTDGVQNSRGYDHPIFFIEKLRYNLSGQILDITTTDPETKKTTSATFYQWDKNGNLIGCFGYHYNDNGEEFLVEKRIRDIEYY